jgi:hypothetical protein
MKRSGIFFRNFAKPQLYEGRPEGELGATVVQPQRVVQKARAASLLYNGKVLSIVGKQHSVRPALQSGFLIKLNIRLVVAF